MEILLTILVLSLVVLLVCTAYHQNDPFSETNARIGAASILTAFLSGLAAILLFIWS